MSDEPIEVWQAEFDELAMKNGSEWMLYEGNAAWQGFLMAKRSQPVIELPEILPMSLVVSSKEYGRNMALREAAKAITAAGYQYKVKE